MNLFNCTTPIWFKGFDVTLEILFFLVTFAIAIAAYKAYKTVNKNEILFFGLAFLSIGVGYLQEAIYNFSLMFGIRSFHLSGVIGPVANSLNLGFLVTLIHMVTFIVGLSLLVYILLPKRSKKFLGIIAGLAIIGLFTSSNIVLTFLLTNTLILFGLTLHHYQSFLKKKTKASLYNFIGFGSIFLAQFQLALAPIFPSLYVSSHITTLFGFSLLLTNLLRVIRK